MCNPQIYTPRLNLTVGIKALKMGVFQTDTHFSQIYIMIDNIISYNIHKCHVYSFFCYTEPTILKQTETETITFCSKIS